MSTLKVDAIRHNSATSDAITMASDGTCTARITGMTGGGGLSHRNIIINGAMNVAQRASSSTTSGYGDLDRWKHEYGSVNENPTFAQVSLTTSDTPYTLGLTKTFKLTNGNQTSGLQAASQINFNQQIEAQNIRNSGWNYKSSSSYITLSFWVRSSVSQNFHGFVKTADGTHYVYPYETGTLSANTWTKITKSIPGNSNLQIDDDNGSGFQVFPIAIYGTNYTSNSTTNDAWANWSGGSARTKDQTATWFTTNDSTLEITGVQLEVGDTATSFEHRSYADELARCQRYYQFLAPPIQDSIICFGGYIVNEFVGVAHFTHEMRATPTLVVSNFSLAFRVYGDDGNFNPSTLTTDTAMNTNRAFYLRASSGTDVGDAHLRILSSSNNGGVFATVAVQSEI